MEKSKAFKMTIDIFMTLLSIILMGGTMLFPDDRVHQILGMVLLVLWIIHTALHRRWYAALFKGKYPPYRIMQIVVNVGISLCALLLMVSGMMMAWFLPVDLPTPLGFARNAHLVSSHWYYLFMSFHLGMHMGSIFARMGNSQAGKASEGGSKKGIIIKRIVLALGCAYGIYAFIVRGVAKYMILLQQFFFLDLEKGYFLFALDYISILVFFAAISHYLGKFLLKTKMKKKESVQNEL